MVWRHLLPIGCAITCPVTYVLGHSFSQPDGCDVTCGTSLLILNRGAFMVSADRVFRDHRDAFETSDARFVGEYRLTKGVTRWLCGQLRGKLQRRREGPRVLTVEQQVLAALRFYAAGGFQGTVRSDENIRVHQRSRIQPVLDPEDRVVGGAEAVPGSWPWHAQLRVYRDYCSGVLISDRHVLTAAHCVSPSGARETSNGRRYNRWPEEPSEGAETADGTLRRRVDGPVAIRLTKRPPEQRPPRKTEDWSSALSWTAPPCSDFRSFLLGERNGRRGKAQAAFQCPAFPESWGYIEVVSTPGNVIVAVAAASPACLSPLRSPEDPAPRLLAKMAAATLPLPGLVSKPATRGIQSRTQAVDPCRQAARIPSWTRPSFKQAVGVVVINGVGLPDTRNHEAEFPEGAGSPLPILGECAFGTP
ncbi:hypothetical protein HPB47_012991 [Ixodes persulcatus]|uniref:Uncharacterized protein n=1 Tax=Ixodes persulcatus TaxID=34615 RepID=A0AC60NS10_IXOPE|nr:hypothetical protein HPB47_012991 [Ixodes persulcatus]